MLLPPSPPTLPAARPRRRPALTTPRPPTPLETDDGLVDISGDEGFVDISGDGGVLKGILVEGAGDDLPSSGSRVSMHYNGALRSNGFLFDSSRETPGTCKFVLGADEVIKGWEVGVLTMKQGEVSVLRIRSDYAYGEKGSPPKIPGGVVLDYEVELYRWWDKDAEQPEDAEPPEVDAEAAAGEAAEGDEGAEGADG